MSKRRIILALFSLIVITSIIIGFTYWDRSRVGESLELEIKGAQQVSLGAPFEVKISILNKSSSVLNQSRLTISLPPGLAFVGSPETKNIDIRELGAIGEGGLIEEDLELIATDGENTLKQIAADLSYLPSSIGSRFEKNTTFDLSVGKPALQLDIVTPQKVLSGEEFEIEVSYRNDSDKEFSDLRLRLEYPPIFKFQSATLPPDEGENIWQLGSLRPKSEMKFKVRGQMIGPDNSFFDLRGLIERNLSGISYVISENVASLSLSPSPLSLKIFLNEDPDYVISPGNILRYNLHYVNNTDIGLRDVILTAKLTGAMFDFSTLGSNGTYRSIDHTITWNAATTPELKLLEPGDSGQVGFQINALSNYPIRRLADRNFTLKVAAQIESPTVPYFLAAERTIGLATMENKVRGAVEIQSVGLFRDSASGVVNTGPFPPQANKSTQYVIRWKIKNFSTDISKIQVRAFLAGDTRFVRMVKANTSEVPVYNSRTQEITWDIGAIRATRGVLESPIEAIFQIETTPSNNMIGQHAPLIQETYLTATDDFTGKTLQSQDGAITSALPEDPTVDYQSGIVIP